MYDRALTLFRKKIDEEDKVQRFYNYALSYFGAKYVWGSEHFQESDCSGLIAGTLALLGHPIRETAEGFRKMFFKTTTPTFDKTKIKCIFFVPNHAYKTASGLRPAGHARHIGLLVGENVILDATVPTAKIETLEDIKKRYTDCSIEIKEIDWEKVEACKTHYSFDVELRNMV